MVETRAKQEAGNMKVFTYQLYVCEAGYIYLGSEFSLGLQNMSRCGWCAGT